MRHWSLPITVITLLLALSGLLTTYSLRVLELPQPPAAIRIGVTPGPHLAICQVAKEVAESEGLTVQIVVYSNYSKLNTALAQGAININSFQHQPYLDKVKDDYKFDLVAAGKTFLYPIGVYSKTLKRLDELPNGGKVLIPMDLDNCSRALLLLQKIGLLQLKDASATKALPSDILRNPKKLHIQVADGEMIAQMINECDIALLNANFALAAGLQPSTQALALEDTASPYVNILAVRAADSNNADLKKFVSAYHSTAVKDFIAKEYKGAMLAAW